MQTYYFKYKNVSKNEGGTSHRIHYYLCKDIKLSIKLPFFALKYFKGLNIEQYNSSFQNISYTKCCKDVVALRTEVYIILERYPFKHKITIPRSKIFWGIEEYNSLFQNIFGDYVQAIFVHSNSY